MNRNYLMLPEIIQRRHLPGVSVLRRTRRSETFMPIYRAGRLAPGAARVKKAEERSGADPVKSIKKLEQAPLPGGEPMEVNAAPVPIATNEQDDSGSLLL
ncbi:hypothetical protein M378DRAFT_10873 [Amanita muscaria Koide BX008]|uniref:Uncharacterized protein n=1 Tax=Amanita muscaria (strain Koide BX008) TaxID=946122 RepID=A0A0C2WTY9_AMAMK|nr:hypothetical protein M378DRAFT_10873 [Amanita muscaria Koide BX008]